MSKKEFEQAIKNDLGDFNISDDSEELQQPTVERTKRIKNARWISIELIQPDPDQPRKKFDQDSIQQLAQSIKEHGILQPIVVEKIESNETYKIVHGERRYRAACSIQVSEMPCIIQSSLTTTKKYAQQIVENIQREDLSPIDKARALLEYKEMMGKEGTWTEVEQAVGISETMRKRFIALLKLPEEIQQQIVSRNASTMSITEKHARALLKLNKYPQEQFELFEKMNKESGVSSEEAMRIAKGVIGENSTKVFKLQYSNTAELIAELEKRLEQLKTKQLTV